MAKYDLNTPMKELVENEETAAVLRDVLPDLIDGPMSGMVKGLPMGLNAILGFAGGQIPQEKVKELEEKLAQLG